MAAADLAATTAEGTRAQQRVATMRDPTPIEAVSLVRAGGGNRRRRRCVGSAFLPYDHRRQHRRVRRLRAQSERWTRLLPQMVPGASQMLVEGGVAAAAAEGRRKESASEGGLRMRVASPALAEGVARELLMRRRRRRGRVARMMARMEWMRECRIVGFSSPGCSSSSG